MRFEVEQKFPVDAMSRVQRALVELGATVQPELAQVDRYFAHPARDFAKTDEALRIRHVGDRNFITYKGPKLDTTTKTRREIELLLAPGEEGFNQFAELLIALGFRSVAQVRKIRQPYELRWEGQIVEIALDDVADVGTFVELELLAEAVNLDAAKACIQSLAERLQLSNSERRSYLELLLKKSGLSEAGKGP